MAKKKRKVYQVQWRSGLRRWSLSNTDPKRLYLRKVDAIRGGRFKCRMKRNQPAQLVIHKKNGRIQTEHTYGNDPRRSKG